MVLPTNCDEAPRLGTILKPRLWKWASAASTVWAMVSMPVCRDGALLWLLEVFQMSVLLMDADGAFLAEAQNSCLPAPHMLLYLTGLSSTRQIPRDGWVPEYVNNLLGDWQKEQGLLPAGQTVQMVLSNRTNRSQSVLVFQDQGQHHVEDTILNFCWETIANWSHNSQYLVLKLQCGLFLALTLGWCPFLELCCRYGRTPTYPGCTAVLFFFWARPVLFIVFPPQSKSYLLIQFDFRGLTEQNDTLLKSLVTLLLFSKLAWDVL